MNPIPSLCIKTISQTFKEAINYYTTCESLEGINIGVKALYKLKNEIKEKNKKDFLSKLPLPIKTPEFLKNLTGMNFEAKMKDMFDKIPFKKTDEKGDKTEGDKPAGDKTKGDKTAGDNEDKNGQGHNPKKSSDKFDIFKRRMRQQFKESAEADREELLLVTEKSIMFLDSNYKQGLKDVISFKNLKKIKVSNKGGKKDEIEFIGISDYDYIRNDIREEELEEKNLPSYKYKLANPIELAEHIRTLCAIISLKIDIDYGQEAKNEEVLNKTKTEKNKDKSVNKEEEEEEEEEESNEEEEQEEIDEAKDNTILSYFNRMPEEVFKKDNKIKTFSYKGYQFGLNKKFKKDLIQPGTYYLLEKKGIKETKTVNKNAEKKGEKEPPENCVKTKICMFIKDETPVECLYDNSTLNSLKFQAYENLYFYLNETIPDIGEFYLKPLKKIVKKNKPIDEKNDSTISRQTAKTKNKTGAVDEDLDHSLWKGYKTEINSIADTTTNTGYKIMFFYLRRKFIPPFYETFNDIVILIIENYSVEKGNYTFSTETKDTVDILIETLSPTRFIKSNSVTKKMVNEKILSFLVDGKTLKFFKNELGIKRCPWSDMVMDYRIKLYMYYQKFCNNKNIDEKMKEFEDEINKNLKELSEILTKEKNDKRMFSTDIQEYKKDLEFRTLDKIIKLPLKEYENLFSQLDDQDRILYESKIAFYMCQNLVEKVHKYDIFADVLNLAKRKKEFLLFFKEPLNFLLNLRILDYENQIKNNVDIIYILEHTNEILDIFYNEKLLAILIEKNLLKDIQNVSCQVSYFNFLKYILTKKLTFKILKSVCGYLESLREESPYLKAHPDPISPDVESKTIITNTDILLPVILNIFTQSSNNPLLITLTTKCLQNLIILDYENERKISNNDFYSILGEHFLASDQIVVYNSIYLLVLLTKKKFDQTKILTGNKTLLMKLINIFKGINISNHYFHPEVILLLLKYFKELITNQSISEILAKEKNKKFIKYFLKYLYSYESSFSEADNCYLYYFDINTEFFNFMFKYIDQNAESKKYLEFNFNFFSVFDKKCLEFNMIIDKFTGGKVENMELNSLIDSVLSFLKEFIGSDEKRINAFKTDYNNVAQFVEKSDIYARNILANCNEKRIEPKNEINSIKKKCKDIKKVFINPLHIDNE